MSFLAISLRREFAELHVAARNAYTLGLHSNGRFYCLMHRLAIVVTDEGGIHREGNIFASAEAQLDWMLDNRLIRTRVQFGGFYGGLTARNEHRLAKLALHPG